MRLERMFQWIPVAVLLLMLPFLFVRPNIAPQKAPLQTVLKTVAPKPVEAAQAEPFRYTSRAERLAAVPPENPSEAAMLQAAREFHIPEDVALALMQNESGGNPTVVSGAGAVGLGQLMPGTAASIASQLNITSYDLNDPATNARFSMFLLRQNWDKEKDLERALRAYNAGPSAVEQSYEYGETNAYVANILALREGVFQSRANVPTLRIFASGVIVTQGVSQGNHSGDGYDNGFDLIPDDPSDTTIRATFDAEVAALVNQPALCGFGIELKAGTRYKALLCHMQEPSKLPVGTSVVAGDALGTMGSSGETTGPHTHYSVLYSLDEGVTYHLLVPKEQ